MAVNLAEPSFRLSQLFLTPGNWEGGSEGTAV